MKLKEFLKVKDEYGDIVITIGDVEKTIRIPFANVVTLITDDIEVE